MNAPEVAQRPLLVPRFPRRRGAQIQAGFVAVIQQLLREITNRRGAEHLGSIEKRASVGSGADVWPKPARRCNDRPDDERDRFILLTEKGRDLRAIAYVLSLLRRGRL